MEKNNPMIKEIKPQDLVPGVIYRDTLFSTTKLKFVGIKYHSNDKPYICFKPINNSGYYILTKGYINFPYFPDEDKFCYVFNDQYFKYGRRIHV